MAGIWNTYREDFVHFSATTGLTRPKNPRSAERAWGFCGGRGCVSPAVAERVLKAFSGFQPSCLSHRPQFELQKAELRDSIGLRHIRRPLKNLDVSISVLTVAVVLVRALDAEALL